MVYKYKFAIFFFQEFVPLDEYGQNLMKIKELLIESGAQVAFALTTPVPIAGRRNERVVAYNKEARRYWWQVCTKPAYLIYIVLKVRVN